MPSRSTLRLLLSTAALATVLSVGTVLALHFITDAIQSRVIEMLGPLGHADSIQVGLKGIELTHVTLRAPPGWPATDALRAETVTIEPDLRELMSGRTRIRRVAIDNFYLSALRVAHGPIQLLPNLKQSALDLRRKDVSEGRPPRETQVDQIDFTHGRMDFFDATVRKPPYRIRIDDAHGRVENLHFPLTTAHTRVELSGALRGPAHTGRLSSDGWIALATKDSDTTTRLSGVDVVLLSPYLTRKSDIAVKSGTFDLDMHSTVRNYQLHAPGTLTLNRLELANGDGALARFMSIPRQVALAALKDRHDKVTLRFTLDGNLRDPRFSLNEDLATRIANGFAKALGVNAEGLAKGAGETATGLGNALKNLLGP
jgi:hypothetical protein